MKVGDVIFSLQNAQGIGRHIKWQDCFGRVFHLTEKTVTFDYLTTIGENEDSDWCDRDCVRLATPVEIAKLKAGGFLP